MIGKMSSGKIPPPPPPRGIEVYIAEELDENGSIVGYYIALKAYPYTKLSAIFLTVDEANAWAMAHGYVLTPKP